MLARGLLDKLEELLSSSLALINPVETNAGEDEELSYTFDQVHNYFLREFSDLLENTRSTITESFLGITEPFTSGTLRKHFSGECHLNPEATSKGRSLYMISRRRNIFRQEYSLRESTIFCGIKQLK